MCQTYRIRLRTYIQLAWLCFCLPVFAVAQGLPAAIDTLDARGYIPLQLGNTWEYHHSLFRPPTPERPTDASEQRRERYVLVDSLVRRDTVFYTLVFEEQREQGTLLRRDTALVWYDESSAALVADGYAGVFEFLTCLDSDFGSNDDAPPECSPYVEAVELFLPELVQADFVVGKVFESLVWSHVVVHGVGLVAVGGGCEPCDAFSSTDYWSLAYASIGGRSYGRPIVTVSVEEIVTRPAPTSLAVWPNPTTGVVVVATPRDQMIAVYDVLGRQLARADASSAGQVQLDLRGLPSGVYVIVGGRQATTVVLL